MNSVESGGTGISDCPFRIDDFRAPRHYLDGLMGGDAARAALAAMAPGNPCGAYDGEDIPVRVVAASCVEDMRVRNNELLGAGPDIAFGSTNLINAAALQGVTLIDSMRRAIDAMKIVRSDLIVKVRRDRSALRFGFDSRWPRSLERDLGLEVMLISLHCTFRWLTGKPLRPLHAHTVAWQEGHDWSMFNMLGCPVLRQGEGFTLHYAPEAAAFPTQPVKYESWAAQEVSEFVRLLQDAADERNSGAPAFDRPVISHVEALLAKGVRGEAAVAAQLGMSIASLRRRIAEAGSGFRTIQSDHQRDQVALLMATGKPLEAIAAEVGFSDVRSLRRACRRWFGVTLAELRFGNPRSP